MELLTDRELAMYQKVTGYEAVPLDPKEENRLKRAIDRMFTIRTRDRDINIVHEFMKEVAFGACVAKKQLGQPFGGLFPKPNEFGITRISPGFFGYNTWINNLTTTNVGDTKYFIDNTTPPNMGGTGNRPAKIGRPVGCHLVLAVRSFSNNPSVERIFIEKDGKAYPVVDISDIYETELKMKPLDVPLFLVGGSLNSEIRMQVYFGSGTADSLGLYGVSFLKFESLKVFKPSDMASNTIDAIVVY